MTHPPGAFDDLDTEIKVQAVCAAGKPNADGEIDSVFNGCMFKTHCIALRQQRDRLAEALQGIIADLKLRAELEDPDDPVLNVGSGILYRARAALAEVELK